MDNSLESSRLGFWGFYRFTNPEWEGRYQARIRQWCFWPTICHLFIDLALDGEGLIGYLYEGAEHLPAAFWWTASVDVFLVLFLLGLRFSMWCRQRIIPLHCMFIWLVMVRTSVLIPLQANKWTSDSYTYIVPASASSIYVEGPSGPTDVSTLLREHFATLAGYRAVQIAYVSAFPPGVYTMLMGLNEWTLFTAVLLVSVLAAGIATTPFLPVLSKAINPCALAALMALGMLFATAFERMQRRNFESQRLLQWELQASQMADSVLNHSLKNTFADVAGNIEMFLAGAMHARALEDCIVSLRRGISSCKERQVYLQLVAGQYQPVLNAINLQDFGRQLLAGRHAQGQFPDSTIYADYMLLSLIFDNALSNAGKHGHPSNPDVTFTIEEVVAEDDLPPDKRRFRFQVTNIANPCRAELTPEYVRQLFSGGGERRRGSVVSTLSDRIGLNHCVLAAKLGGITLSLSQERDRVTFCGTLDAELAPNIRPTSARSDGCLSPTTPPLPPGLRFVIMDDSLSAQKLLRFHIEKLCEPAAVLCFGARASDVEAFMATALDADIIIVDQNLDWPGNGCLGTDLVKQLRTVRYDGFICIRSANDGPADQALYLRSGADCSVGKDLLGPVMLRQLRVAYHQYSNCRPSSASTSSPMRRPSGILLSGLSRGSAIDLASSSGCGSDVYQTLVSQDFGISPTCLRLTSLDGLLMTANP